MKKDYYFQVGLVYFEVKNFKDLFLYIYVIVSKVYRNLIWGRVNQVILVSGELGVGSECFMLEQFFVFYYNF